jgi:hypothetical protein
MDDQDGNGNDKDEPGINAQFHHGLALSFYFRKPSTSYLLANSKEYLQHQSEFITDSPGVFIKQNPAG